MVVVAAVPQMLAWRLGRRGRFAANADVEAVVAEAAVLQMLAWRPRWSWLRCRKCWRGGRGGRGRCAANAYLVCPSFTI